MTFKLTKLLKTLMITSGIGTFALVMLLISSLDVNARNINMVASEWAPYFGPDLREDGLMTVNSASNYFSTTR